MQAAAGRARAMLGLSPAAAAALAELFGGGGGGRASLLPDSAGIGPSISGLCRWGGRGVGVGGVGVGGRHSCERCV